MLEYLSLMEKKEIIGVSGTKDIYHSLGCQESQVFWRKTFRKGLVGGKDLIYSKQEQDRELVKI